MKNFFLLLAAILLTVFTASSQVSYAEQSGTRVIIKHSTGITKSYSLINRQQLLGFGSSVVCISNGNNILILNADGKPCGEITLINGEKFLACSGSEVITINPRGRKTAYSSAGKALRYL